MKGTFCHNCFWSLTDNITTALAAILMVVFVSSCADVDSPAKPSEPECSVDVDCDDHVACTEDKCVVSGLTSGRCESVPRDELCDPDEQCVTFSDSATGCVPRMELWCYGKNDNDQCSPQDACAIGAGVCRHGACEYDRKTCPDRVCLVGRGCNRLTGQCEYVPASIGQVCEFDDDPCTEDRCVEGVCTAGNDVCECSDERPCPLPEDLCDGIPTCNNGVCVASPVSCPVSANPCREFVCQPSTGICEPNAVREGLACPDTLTCTIKETCHDGQCLTNPLICDERTCSTALCIEPDGCVYLPIQDGLLCDDGNACNGVDACLSGQCVAIGSPLACDDANPCTIDSCDPVVGDCVHDLVQNCCGNAIVEANEECDPPSTICSECRFAPVDIASSGGALAITIDSESSVWTAYETSDAGFRRMWLQSSDKLGNLSGEHEIFSIQEDSLDGRLCPGLAALPDGVMLLSHFDGSGLPVRVYDHAGNARLLTTVVEPFSDGQFGHSLKLAAGPDASLLAFEIVEDAPDGRENRIIRYAVVQANRDKLVVSRAVSVEPDVSFSVKRLLGDLCAGKDGFLVVYSKALSDNTFKQIATFVDTDGLALEPIVLGDFPGDFLPAPRCASLDDGEFVVTFSVMEAMGGVMQIGVRSVIVDSTNNQVQKSSDLFFSDGADGDIGLPVVASLVNIRDHGTLYLSSFIDVATIDNPDEIKLYGLFLDDSGKPYGTLFPVPGATGGLLADIATVRFWEDDVAMLMRQIPKDSPNFDSFGTIVMRMFAGDGS